MSRQALITAALVALTISGTAAAATVAATTAARMTATEGRPVRKVSFADVDLTSPAGRATLDRRLRSAVADVCPTANSRDLADFQRRRECTRAAMADAMHQRDVAIAQADPAVQVATIAITEPAAKTG